LAQICNQGQKIFVSFDNYLQQLSIKRKKNEKFFDEFDQTLKLTFFKPKQHLQNRFLKNDQSLIFKNVKIFLKIQKLNIHIDTSILSYFQNEIL